MATEKPATERPATERPATDPFVTGPGTAPSVAVPAASPAHEKPKSQAELRADAARARAELAGTLDAIELKLNLPYQAKLRGRRFRMGVQKLQDDNPLAIVGLMAGSVAVVGGTIWLGVRALQRR